MSSVPSSRAPVVPGRPLTQGNLVSIDEGVAATLRAFDRVDVELRRELERLVAIIVADPDATAAYRASQVRRLLTRVGTAQAELLGQSTLFVEESLGRLYAEGMLRADAIAAAGGAAALGQPSFTLMHRQALEVLAIDAFDDLAAATSYLDTATKRTIREATKLRTSAMIASGEGPDRAARRLARTLARRGVTGFVDAAGRNWRLSSYASMVIRTKSAHAYNTGTILRTDETGTGVLEILDGVPSGHEECERYNGDTCDAAWALANPLEHPNCVRSFGPLPLFRGEPQHTAGGSVRDVIARERARRDLPDGLVVRPPEL